LSSPFLIEASRRERREMRLAERVEAGEQTAGVLEHCWLLALYLELWHDGLQSFLLNNVLSPSQSCEPRHVGLSARMEQIGSCWTDFNEI
jgi:hypothetical protein